MYGSGARTRIRATALYAILIATLLLCGTLVSVMFSRIQHDYIPTAPLIRSIPAECSKGLPRPNPIAAAKLIPTPYATDLAAGTKAPNLYIVTYATHLEAGPDSRAGACAMLKTAYQLEYKVNVLGYWRYHALTYMKSAPHRHEDKSWFLVEAAQQLASAGEHDAIVVYVDATDSLFQLSPAELVQRFRAIGRPLVYSAESNCHPPGITCDLYRAKHVPRDQRENPLIWPNAGAVVGTAAGIVEALGACYTTRVHISHLGYPLPSYLRTQTDDQIMPYFMILDCPIKAQRKPVVDFAQSIFGSMYRMTSFYAWHQGLWKYVPPESRSADLGPHVYLPQSAAPAILHFNGDAKSDPKLGLQHFQARSLERFNDNGAGFLCSTVHVVGYRDVYAGEFCPSPSAVAAASKGGKAKGA